MIISAVSKRVLMVISLNEHNHLIEFVVAGDALYVATRNFKRRGAGI